MQGIDFGHSKRMLEQIAAQPDSNQVHMLYEILWTLIVAVERLQVDAKRGR